MATNDPQKQQTVTRNIEVPNEKIFEVLAQPARHQDFDGSGMVRAENESQRLTKVGDTFIMNMYAEAMGGDYQMENHVVAFEENQLIGWQPAPVGKEPGGWQWIFTLEPVEPNITRVIHTYDWSHVEDPKMLKMFPVVNEEQMEESLSRLAEMVS